jgi:hypothetical protein
MSQNPELADLFSLPNVMRYSGYELLPGGQVAIDEAEADICARNHKNNPESVAAHQTATKGREKAKNAIQGHLRLSNGLSRESLEQLTGLSHQTCSARLAEMRQDGQIVKCGTTKTRSGCSASLYRICAT